MNTAQVKLVIDEYLIDYNSKSAILLNGAWGCGKTFFLKEEVYKIAIKNKLNPIYISLYGLTEVETLEKQILVSVLPFYNNKYGLRISNSKLYKKINSIYSGTSNKILDLIGKSILEEIDFSKFVICFDDLERSTLDVKNIFGYVNSFVEHKKMKVIFISNENEIKNGDKDYNSVKEKIISRVLNLELNISEVLPVFFESFKVKNKKYHLFLSEYKDFILELLIDFKNENLRTVNFFLNILEKVYNQINSLDKLVLKKIIVFTLAISIEFKNGKLTISDLDNNKRIDLFYQNYLHKKIINANKKVIDDTVEYFEEFIEKYYLGKEHFYTYFNSIYTFILSGYLDRVLFENEYNKLLPLKNPEFIEEYLKLIHFNFRQLESDEFNRLSNRVITNAENGLFDLYSYYNIAKFYFFFASNKLIDLNVDDIKSKINKGLDIVTFKNEIDYDLYENIKHFHKNESNLNDIFSKITSIHLKWKNIKLSNYTYSFIECVKNNDVKQLKQIFQEMLGNENYLSFVDKNAFFKQFKSSSNAFISQFSISIETRYDSKRSLHYDGDRDFLNDLNNLIKNEMIEMYKNDYLKSFLLKSLSIELEKILA